MSERIQPHQPHGVWRSPEMITEPLIARNGAVTLAGSLWLPSGRSRGLVLMHPGSGPIDRDNFAPPARLR